MRAALLATALALAGCASVDVGQCSSDGYCWSRTMAPLPVKAVLTLPHDEMMARCHANRSIGGCAVRLPDGCTVIMSDHYASPSLLAHELNHCDGWDHVVSPLFR